MSTGAHLLDQKSGLDAYPVVEEISSLLNRPAEDLDASLTSGERAAFREAARELNAQSATGDPATFYGQQLLLSRIYGLSTQLPESPTAEGSVVVQEVLRHFPSCESANQRDAGEPCARPPSSLSFPGWVDSPEVGSVQRTQNSMKNQEMRRLGTYFDEIVQQFTVEQPTASLLVTRLLPERPTFVQAVARMSDLRAVLSKPKSISPDTLAAVQRPIPCDPLSRDVFGDPDGALKYLETRAAGMPVVLLEIGGYFAPALSEMCNRFSGQILGVVEDTENGHQRYAELDKLPCPVSSLARSPLKDPEDFLVGQSVVFSTEALLRTQGGILVGRKAAVIGFGKLGSSIARPMHAKGVQVTVYDIGPMRSTQALSQGFSVAASLEAALRELCDETGIPAVSVAIVDQVPVDINAHTIPENPKKAEPEHTHFDFRFVFRTRGTELALQTEEVTDARWRPVQDIPEGRLRSRVQACPDRAGLRNL